MNSVEFLESENVLVTLWKFYRKYPNSVRQANLEAVEYQILKPQYLYNGYRVILSILCALMQWWETGHVLFYSYKISETR
jgi:hypothetical protein